MIMTIEEWALEEFGGEYQQINADLSFLAHNARAVGFVDHGEYQSEPFIDDPDEVPFDVDDPNGYQRTVKYEIIEPGFMFIVSYFSDGGENHCITDFNGDKQKAIEWLEANYAKEWRAELEASRSEYDDYVEGEDA